LRDYARGRKRTLHFIGGFVLIEAQHPRVLAHKGFRKQAGRQQFEVLFLDGL